jgi:glucose-6-phosphate 1-dehydrogenase
MLYDCMVGDATLFHRTDMVEAAWKAAQPILDGWAENPPTDFPNYAPGDWGPKASEELMTRDNHTWWLEPKA